jgi:hypothetical protein
MIRLAIAGAATITTCLPLALTPNRPPWVGSVPEGDTARESAGQPRVIVLLLVGRSSGPGG